MEMLAALAAPLTFPTFTDVFAHLFESARSANSINMLKQFQNPNRVRIKAPNWLRKRSICFLLGAAMAGDAPPPATLDFQWSSGQNCTIKINVLALLLDLEKRV